MKKIENFEELEKSYAYKLLQSYGKKINQPIEDLPQNLQIFLLFWLTFNITKHLLEEWGKK